MNGIVIKSTGKHYRVKLSDSQIVKCKLKGKFRISGFNSTNPIVVGDEVEVMLQSDSWNIVSIKERKNCIIRKSVNLSKKKHIIAANIDQAILMITLKSPITTTGFIDRFLVAANAYDVNVILLFNKTDLLTNSLIMNQKSIIKIYEKIGYKCLALSTINDDLSIIKNLMNGKKNVISGHSGVGKSTLINKLQPGLNINTKNISDTHKKGQHTTTFSQLYELDFGGSIIDTPGIKGFGLVELDLHQICNYFPDFLSYKKSCKFYNCIHRDEPSCAVKLALKNGEISYSRYSNYLKMLEDNFSNANNRN